MLKLRGIAQAAVLIWATLYSSPLVAQGTDTGTGLSQERTQGTIGQALVHAGAGTTSASTTGYSGQREKSPASSGKIELPPLPDAALCDAYKGRPGFDGCLSVVLPQKARSPQ